MGYKEISFEVKEGKLGKTKCLWNQKIHFLEGTPFEFKKNPYVGGKTKLVFVGGFESRCFLCFSPKIYLAWLGDIFPIWGTGGVAEESV